VTTDHLQLEAEPDMEEGEPQTFCLHSKQLGYAIRFSNGTAVTVFLYTTPSEGYSQFCGDLPSSLTSNASRQTVLDAMGTPERSGEPRQETVIGDTGAWDRFSYHEVIIHFQYRIERDGLALVTLMAPHIAP